jgi:hypothetical protein
VVQYFHRAPSKSSSGDRKLLVSAACFLTARAAALLIFTSPIKHRKAFPKRRKGFSRERYLYGKKAPSFSFLSLGSALSAAAVATREENNVQVTKTRHEVREGGRPHTPLTTRGANFYGRPLASVGLEINLARVLFMGLYERRGSVS